MFHLLRVILYTSRSLRVNTKFDIDFRKWKLSYGENDDLWSLEALTSINRNILRDYGACDKFDQLYRFSSLFSRDETTPKRINVS